MSIKEYIDNMSEEEYMNFLEETSDDYYMTYIDHVKNIHMIIKEYCDIYNPFIYDKVKTYYELYEFIETNSESFDNFFYKKVEKNINDEIAEKSNSDDDYDEY